MGFDGYDLGETLARSPRSHVRRAVRRTDGRAVIIKSLAAEYPSPRETSQLEFEYRLLGRLGGRGVIGALDLARSGDRVGLVLEDFGAQDLTSFDFGQIPLDRFFVIAIGIARALGEVHGANVIHKDVKPQNILFNARTGEVRLIDFSISSELSRCAQDVALVNQLEGTLPYMSPEQTGRMNRDVDDRTDTYSLGVTFFELLTGALPFTAADPLGWVHCHVSRPVPSARERRPEIPDALARIVAKLMAKSPDDRYQSARGLVTDLERCRRDWTETGAIADFEVGQHDASERFQVPRALYGRALEQATLLNVLEDTSRGPARLLLVTGASGVGKSSLIHELHRSVATRGGAFIAGKFDQLGREVPYGALAQALRELVKQLLAEPDDRLHAWREKIAAALGSSGQVLVDLIPELERVVGAQPRVADLNAREARNRFQRVCRDFLGAVADVEHPLVMFIDDLQWTDASTPDLLAHLLGDEGLRHVLIVAAYRDNELAEGHPMRLAMDDLATRRPDAIQRMVLPSLSADGVNQIVAATLRREPEACRTLGERIFDKTAGNPFFVNELLELYHREGAFQYVAASGRWDWDDARIDAAGINDNVVELMVQKLKLLPELTLDCLRLASCIGDRFDLLTLSRLMGRPAGAVSAALRAAVEAHVVIPLGGSYRFVRDDGDYDDAQLMDLDVRYQFQHDRVQEAAYSQIDGAERARVHLALGRILLVAARGGDADKEIFEVVNHLNLGRALITDPAERARLVRLNETAGRMAKRAAAYSIAAAYLEVGVELMSPDERAAEPRRLFESRRTHVECVYLAGDVERASALCDELAAGAPDRLAAAAAVQLKALIQSHQGCLFEAVETIRAGLGALGVELPADPAEIGRKIGEGIGKMQGHLGRTSIEDLVGLPEMTDELPIMVMKLLHQIIPSAIQTNPPLFVLAELMMFDLALVHGVTAVSCKNVADCGMLQAGILGDFDRAYRLGKAAFALVDRYAPTPLEASVNFVFASFLSHWRAPFREGLESFVTAQRLAVESGDLLHASYVVALEAHRHLAVGIPLGACYTKAESAAAYLTQTHSTSPMGAVRVMQRALAQLRGSGADARMPRPSDEDDEFTREIVAARNPQWLFLHGQTEAMVSYILGDVEAASAWTDFAAPYLPAAASTFGAPDHVLFGALALAAKAAAAPETERGAMLAALAASRDKLKIWGESCPENFTHKHKLLAAEIARVEGAPIEDVIRLYDEALLAAGDGFLHLRALINERQADFWFTRQQPRIAKTFLQEAYFLYGRWGGHRKLRQMERQHADWLGRAPDGESPAGRFTVSHDTVLAGSLDVTSVIKATQAISSEVRPDKLFAKLMAAIIENAGAQRGCLILTADTGDALAVAARAAVDPDPAEATQATAIDDCDDLCPRIVRYVARTHDTVVIDDARHHAVYQDDGYVQRHAVKSVLSLPVLNQGKLLAILYAENNAVTHAFTPERLTLLQVIASQAAISIRNARLYDSLEERVAARTAELSRANDTLAAEMKVRETMEIELRQAQKLEAVGRLASGVAHEINTPIQFVNDSIQFVRDAMGDLTGLVERYRAVNSALLDPGADVEATRGLAQAAVDAEEQADLAYLLENVPTALARSLDGIDRVATIVRSMKEFAHPDQKDKTTIDLNQAIASTLTIARNEYKYVADVETDFGELSPVTCHAGEVNQAVLNLIVNAAHAIGDVVRGTERKGLIKIATRLEEGAVIISIADTGGGIPDHVRDRIFDPFFTTKEVGKGTGQGLFIARSVIAEKHGGTLTFETEVGKGTTFFVRLPAESGVSETPTAAAAA